MLVTVIIDPHSVNHVVAVLRYKEDEDKIDAYLHKGYTVTTRSLGEIPSEEATKVSSNMPISDTSHLEFVDLTRFRR